MNLIYDANRLVYKGWGSEYWIVNSDLYCSKILEVDSGKMCSYHFHLLKDEYFYITKGSLYLFYSINHNIRLMDIINELMSIHYDQRVKWVLDNLHAIRKTINCVQMNTNDYIHIPSGLIHSFLAIKSSVILETSTRHFEKDSYRIKKGD